MQEQNPDERDVEDDDCENHTTKHPRKKLFFQGTGHHEHLFPEMDATPRGHTTFGSPALRYPPFYFRAPMHAIRVSPEKRLRGFPYKQRVN
jgi:hypothetical protein